MTDSQTRRRGPSVGSVIALVVVIGFGLVIFATTSGGQYAVAISQVTSDPAKFENRKIRVTGNIKHGSARFLTRGDQPETRFAIIDEHGNELEIVYQQAPPDPFKEGRSSVVEGVLQADGTVLCHKLTVKCPSKYQGEGGDGPEDTDSFDAPSFDRYRSAPGPSSQRATPDGGQPRLAAD